MDTTRLPLELLALVVTNALGEHLPALIQDPQRPTWDALLVLTRTSPVLHDLALTSLTRSLGTRWPSRRSFAPNAPFLATSLPKDVRRRLRFMRRICAGNAVDTRAASIESLSRFVLDNRDANSPLAKACICLVTARAMIARRLYNRAFGSLDRCLRFCAQVRPVELADVLHNRAVRMREDLGLGAFLTSLLLTRHAPTNYILCSALRLDTIGRDIMGGFLLPRDQV